MLLQGERGSKGVAIRERDKRGVAVREGDWLIIVI